MTRSRPSLLSQFHRYGVFATREDLRDLRRRLRQARRPSARQEERDRTQDERLEALEQENDDLRVAVVALLDRLVERGALTDAHAVEVASLADGEDELPELPDPPGAE